MTFNDLAFDVNGLVDEVLEHLYADGFRYLLLTDGSVLAYDILLGPQIDTKMQQIQDPGKVVGLSDKVELKG